MKILIGILGAISTLLIMWHVVTPRELWIEGFYGYPLMICGLIIGYSLGVGIEKLREKE